MKLKSFFGAFLWDRTYIFFYMFYSVVVAWILMFSFGKTSLQDFVFGSVMAMIVSGVSFLEIGDFLKRQGEGKCLDQIRKDDGYKFFAGHKIFLLFGAFLLVFRIWSEMEEDFLYWGSPIGLISGLVFPSAFIFFLSGFKRFPWNFRLGRDFF